MTNKAKHPKQSPPPTDWTGSPQPDASRPGSVLTEQASRQQVEEIFQQKRARPPQDLTALSSEALRQTLHELQVHQIDLEIQNLELQQTRMALETAQAHYFDLFNLAPVGYITLTEQGIIEEANLTAATLLGGAKPELARQPISQFICKEDRDIYYLYSKQLAESAGQAGELLGCELRFMRKDSTQFWARMEIVATQNVVEGAPIYRVALRDITQHKQAEAERELLMTAIEQTDECVVITDSRGTIQYVNPVFERRTGYTRQEATGQNPRILKSGQQDKAFYHDLWKTISSGRVWQGRLINKRKNGSLYTEEVSISPVLDTTRRIVNYVAVKRDITEHLHLSNQFQQAQKMESVALLAGGVAHDFNNMLGIILGYTELSLRAVDPVSPIFADLEEIQKAATRSAILTRQLLAFARKQTVAPEVIDLNETAEGMLKMLRRIVGEDINLTWIPETGLWSVKIDPSQVDQILANLCVNAQDAIAGVGKIIVETKNCSFDAEYCSVHPDFVPGEYVKITVSDNGCGMDKLTLPRIFEPFFTTKGAGEGTGLGLASVYSAVQQNKGFINVYSEPGQGTTFTVYLPRYVDQP
jgi:PAS domain S-box-containing protein